MTTLLVLIALLGGSIILLLAVWLDLQVYRCVKEGEEFREFMKKHGGWYREP